MRAVIALAFAMLAGSSLADSVRHLTMPEPFRGRWATSADICNNDKGVIVMSAKAYVSPQATCEVQWVTETAGAGGPIYSAHMRCSGPGPSDEKTEENEILLSRDGKTLSMGTRFNELKVYQRCSAN